LIEEKQSYKTPLDRLLSILHQLLYIAFRISTAWLHPSHIQYSKIEEEEKTLLNPEKKENLLSPGFCVQEKNWFCRQ